MDLGTGRQRSIAGQPQGYPKPQTKIVSDSLLLSDTKSGEIMDVIKVENNRNDLALSSDTKARVRAIFEDGTSINTRRAYKSDLAYF